MPLGDILSLVDNLGRSVLLEFKYYKCKLVERSVMGWEVIGSSHLFDRTSTKAKEIDNS